jgi:hypothetical protein
VHNGYFPGCCGVFGLKVKTEVISFISSSKLDPNRIGFGSGGGGDIIFSVGFGRAISWVS